jgi:RNA polymerase sigma-70 factor (ECF subfamily)
VVAAHADELSEDYANLPEPDFIAEWRKSPEKLAGDLEVRALLLQALDELPEGLRAVFLLRDVEGLSTEEAADALGISPGAAKVGLHRARLQLRERLTRVLGDADNRVMKTHRHSHDQES